MGDDLEGRHWGTVPVDDSGFTKMILAIEMGIDANAPGSLANRKHVTETSESGDRVRHRILLHGDRWGHCAFDKVSGDPDTGGYSHTDCIG